MLFYPRCLSRSVLIVCVSAQTTIILVLQNLANAQTINEERKEPLNLREEEAEVFLKIEEEIIKMIKSCKVQRNVNMMVKDGLKNLYSGSEEEAQESRQSRC